jgi:hypothetical protein
MNEDIIHERYFKGGNPKGRNKFGITCIIMRDFQPHLIHPVVTQINQQAEYIWLRQHCQDGVEFTRPTNI